MKSHHSWLSLAGKERMKQESKHSVPKLHAVGFVLTVLTAFFIFQLPQAFAWKPYTHNYTAHQIWNDVVDDGRVTLAGKTYLVDSRITAALLAYPDHFYAGSVGPD